MIVTATSLLQSLMHFYHVITVVQSAVLRSHVISLSVCMSVCLWHWWIVITYIDFQSTWSQSTKLAYTFALRSPKGIHLLPGELGKIWGRLDVGWGKVECWSTKAAISLKCVRIEENLLWRAYRNSPTLFRTALSPILYGLLFPKIRGSQPPPKTSVAIISGTGEAMDFKFGLNIHRVHLNKNPLKT